VPALGVADGVQDCSSLLVLTVTPEAGTVTETVTVVPTEYATAIDTAILTETVTTTASTETQFVTLGATVTAATQTDVVTVTTTVLATQTDVVTVTTTDGNAGSTRILPRADTLSAPPAEAETPSATGGAAVTPAIPAYATADCPSWHQYVLACKCAGVTPTTITADAPDATTITVSDTVTAVTVDVPSTVTTTETVIVSVTATTAATEVDTASLTATIALTETATVSSTVTVTSTTTQTVQPQATCRPGSEVGAFRATATEWNASPYVLFATLVNGIVGGVDWKNLGSLSTAPNAQARYLFKVDADGYLAVAYNIPPYTYEYLAYIALPTTSAEASAWPQVATRASVEGQMANSGRIAKIKACVNSVTGELTLDAAGRKNILYCGGQLWMAFGDGADVNRGTPCVKMFPKALAPL